jgi:putative FmdB family regulatory protein
MPVYEFYCTDCHKIFHFLSKSVNTEKRPDCPKCGRPDLERQVSLFAVSKGRSEEEQGPMPDIDEYKMGKAMAAMANEAENINEDDPRQAAQLMRKLYNTTGLPLGPGMDEMMRRMESGENPEQVEKEMEDILEAEDPFSGNIKKKIKGLGKRDLPPSVDETLYEL